MNWSDYCIFSMAGKVPVSKDWLKRRVREVKKVTAMSLTPVFLFLIDLIPVLISWVMRIGSIIEFG